MDWLLVFGAWQSYNNNNIDHAEENSARQILSAWWSRVISHQLKD